MLPLKSTTSTTAAARAPEPSQKVLKEGLRLVNLFSHGHLLRFIDKVIKDSIVPLYGEQSAMLAQIKGTDQTGRGGSLAGYRCEVLLKRDGPVGFIIYNTLLQGNSHKILELAHLELIDNERDAGAGFRTLLLRRVEEIARDHFAEEIEVKVANRDPLKAYLINRGFKEDSRLQTDTRAGRSASLLYYKLPGTIARATTADHNNNNNNNAHTATHARDQQRNVESKKRGGIDDDHDRQESSRFSHMNQNRHGDNLDYNRNTTSVNNRDDNDRAKRIKMDEEQPAEPVGGFRRVDTPRFKVPPSQVRHVTLPRQYIHQIRSGEKTIEGRVKTGQFIHYRVGDKVRFFYTQNPDDDVTCEVTAIQSYRGFPEMLTAEGFKKCVPAIATFDQACREYDKIPNYTENARKYGVLAIHLKVIKKDS